MILTCENCNARYLVSDHAIGDDGRSVRCTTCGHEWYQRPPEEGDETGDSFHDLDPIPESVKPMHDGLPLPPFAKTKTDRAGRLAGYAAAACVILLLLGATIPARAAVTKLWPPAAGFYQMIGFETPLAGEGLSFDRVKAARIANEQGVKIIQVGGHIINLKDKDAVIPAIRASLKMGDGRELDSWAVAVKAEMIKAQGDLEFTTSYPAPAGDVKDVTIRFVP